MTEPEIFVTVQVRLTPREMETLHLLREGLSNKRIARRLGISDHGAKRLVGSIMTKLDAESRTAAVVKAIRFGLISVDDKEIE